MVPGAASAQLAERHSFNVNGDVELIGNGLLTCSTSGAGGSDCASHRNGNGGNGNRNMVFINVDPVGGSAPANSSTATLDVPAGANVLSAGLYWAGRANNTSNARRNIWFKAPGGGYERVTALPQDLNTFNTQGDTYSNRPYTAYVDVTARVRSAGSGSYSVGGLTAVTGNGLSLGNYGGWALIVLYEDSSRPLRRLMVFDGDAGYVGSGNPASVTVSGLLTPPNGDFNAYMGALVWEGDADISGDRFRLTGPGVLNGGDLSDAVSPANNFWNSRISRLGTEFTARNPNYP
ncbi:MAG: hypothetical protein GX805_08120, partial [Gammaproteobacteria bacterium]|nr:hypothetical protein [Gammaproteobacteria bacterium]